MTSQTSVQRIQMALDGVAVPGPWRVAEAQQIDQNRPTYGEEWWLRSTGPVPMGTPEAVEEDDPSVVVSEFEKVKPRCSIAKPTRRSAPEIKKWVARHGRQQYWNV